MFKHQETRSRLKGVEHEKPKLRLFGTYQASQALILSTEGAGQENVGEDSENNLGTAKLEAEYQKAKALTAFQNSRRLY